VTRATPRLASAAGSGTVGDAVPVTAALDGAYLPTGTLTLEAWESDDCRSGQVFTKTLPVTRNGDYDFGPFDLAHAGTYRWTASYSGDAENEGASVPCGGPSAATRMKPALTGTATDGVVGDAVHDTATLSGGFTPGGTLVFKAWTTADCTGDPSFVSP